MAQRTKQSAVFTFHAVVVLFCCSEVATCNCFTGVKGPNSPISTSSLVVAAMLNPSTCFNHADTTNGALISFHLIKVFQCFPRIKSIVKVFSIDLHQLLQSFFKICRSPLSATQNLPQAVQSHSECEVCMPKGQWVYRLL